MVRPDRDQFRELAKHARAVPVTRELLAISAEVSGGRPLDAADRADRLADRLEHPAALG